VQSATAIEDDVLPRFTWLLPSSTGESCPPIHRKSNELRIGGCWINHQESLSYLLNRFSSECSHTANFFYWLSKKNWQLIRLRYSRRGSLGVKSLELGRLLHYIYNRYTNKFEVENKSVQFYWQWDQGVVLIDPKPKTIQQSPQNISWANVTLVSVAKVMMDLAYKFKSYLWKKLI